MDQFKYFVGRESLNKGWTKKTRPHETLTNDDLKVFFTSSVYFELILNAFFMYVEENNKLFCHQKICVLEGVLSNKLFKKIGKMFYFFFNINENIFLLFTTFNWKIYWCCHTEVIWTLKHFEISMHFSFCRKKVLVCSIGHLQTHWKFLSAK